MRKTIDRKGRVTRVLSDADKRSFTTNCSIIADFCLPDVPSKLAVKARVALEAWDAFMVELERYAPPVPPTAPDADPPSDTAAPDTP